MSVRLSYSRGIQDALLRPKMALVQWLVNAAFAGIFYFAALGALAPLLERSLAGDALLRRGDVTTYLDILFGGGPAAAVLPRLALLLVVLGLFVRPFLDGGILGGLDGASSGERFGRAFWGSGGRLYGRFFRLTLASVLLLVPAAAIFLGADAGFGALGRDPLKEQLGFYLALGRIATAFLLYVLIKMILDYARIRIALTDQRSAVFALFWAVAFVVRRLIRCGALAAMLGLTALAGTLAYAGIQSLVPKTTAAAVVFGFVLVQVHVIWRSWMRVAVLAAERRFASGERS